MSITLASTGKISGNFHLSDGTFFPNNQSVVVEKLTPDMVRYIKEGYVTIVSPANFSLTPEGNVTQDINNLFFLVEQTLKNLQPEMASREEVGGTELIGDADTVIQATHVVSAFKNSTPTASEVLLRYAAPSALDFPASFTGSAAIADTSATASAVFTLANIGGTVGTITFAESTNIGVFASVDDEAVSLAAGDVLTITSPASPDDTLDNLAISLKGVLTI